jgi:hypothetical protein
MVELAVGERQRGRRDLVGELGAVLIDELGRAPCNARRFADDARP